MLSFRMRCPPFRDTARGSRPVEVGTSLGRANNASRPLTTLPTHPGPLQRVHAGISRLVTCLDVPDGHTATVPRRSLEILSDRRYFFRSVCSVGMGDRPAGPALTATLAPPCRQYDMSGSRFRSERVDKARLDFGHTLSGDK
jgi:hypothetical protein